MDKTESSNETTIANDEIGEIPAPVGATAGAIHARITIERDRLKGEEAIETQLTSERKRLLVEGTDAEIDETERRIDASRSAQVRILERVDLLRGQLIAANAQEESNRLDAVAARGNRARTYGEDLIREYGDLAPKLASILERLKACEEIIQDTNRVLGRAGRDGGQSPNAIRCRRSRRWTETVRKMVGAAEKGHPFYGKPYRSATNAKVVSLDGEKLPTFVEADVEVERYDAGDVPDRLEEAVKLPGVGPELNADRSIAPLWNERSGVSDRVRAEVADRIDHAQPIADAGTKRKKSERSD